jgi:hypothetical protein
MKPHKQSEFIKAWADGATIQYFDNGVWYEKLNIGWSDNAVYRIKPEVHKVKLYIYNNNELRKTFMSHIPPTQTNTDSLYCEYMGSIEVIK